MKDAKLVYILVFLVSLCSVFAVTPTIISPSSGWFTNFSVVLNVSTDDVANVTFNTSAFASTTSLFLNNSTGNFTLNSTFLSEGNNTIYIQAINASNSTDNSTASVANIAVDTIAPSFNESILNQSLEIGSAFSLDINASDANKFRYYVNDTNNFAINAVSGIITNLSLSPGVYTLNVSVNDSAGNENSFIFNVNVTDSITPTWVEALLNQSVEYGSLFSYDVNASDADTILYGSNDSSNFVINTGTGVITNNTVLTVRNYDLNITANDSSNNLLSGVIVVNVTDTTAPTWDQNPSDQLVEFGVQFNYDINASDLAGIDTFTVNNTALFSINSSGYLSNISALGLGGVHDLNITINDTNNNLNSTIVRVTVQETAKPWFNPNPVDQTVEYNSAFSYDVNGSDNVAIDAYAVNDSNNFAINSNGLITNNSLLSVRNYTINITINDTSANENSSLLTITVQDTVKPYFSPNPSSQTVEFGSSFAYDIDAVDNIATFSVNDSDFSINNSGYLVNSSSLSFKTYTLNITINDTSGSQNSTIITVTVQDNTNPWFSPLPTAQSINHSLAFGYQINGADNLNVSGYSVNDSSNFAINSSGYLINNTVLAARVYGLIITVNDTSGNENTTTFSITVNVANTTAVEANTSTEIDFSDADTNITFFLDENVSTTVTVTTQTPNTTGTTASLNALKAVDITVDNSTVGNLTWALIEISYSQAELTAANIDESTLRIYYYNTTASDWQLEPTQDVDTTNDYVWANVSHFSLFGAFGSAPTTEEAAAPSSSGGGSSGGIVTTKYELGVDPMTVILNSYDKLLFDVDDRTHTVQIKNLFDDHVTVTVRSPGIFDVDLYLDETAKVDVNEDGFYDLSMSLDKIYSRSATITFLAISESVPVGEEPVAIVERIEKVVVEDVEVPEEVVEAPPVVKPRKWIPIIFVIIAIIAAIIYFIPKKHLKKLKKRLF